MLFGSDYYQASGEFAGELERVALSLGIGKEAEDRGLRKAVRA